MTCTNLGNAIICTARTKRLKRKGTSTRAVYVEYHPYCGLAFYYGNGAGERMLDWDELPDWVWAEVDKIIWK